MNAITAEGLVKTFGSGEKAVKAVGGVDLVVPEGTVVGLLGPNGAGKTTTVRMLTTLLAPDAGRAVVAGHDVAREPQAVRSKIGLSGQYAAVDENLTGRENLWLFGRLYQLSSKEASKRAGELLEQFNLADAADRTLKTYSGGMRRRLDLAGSLIVHPQVLFLDEPTTGLDPSSRLDLWDVIRERVAEGSTILLTTQYLEEADALADDIVVIDHGVIIAQGTADQLKAQIGGERIEVIVHDPEALNQAEQVLNLGSGGQCVRDDHTRKLTVPTHTGSKGLIQVIRDLDEAGVAIDDIALRRPTLDDVFVKLTGRHAEGDDTQAETAQGEGIVTTDVMPTAAAPNRVGFNQAFTDAMTITWRNIRAGWRVPDNQIYMFIQPIMFVLLFAYVFGGAINVPGVDYVDFLMAGIFVQTMAFACAPASVGLADDMQKGLIDRFRSLPMARSAVIAGRVIADLVNQFIVLAIMIVCGFIVGWTFHNGFGQFLAAIGLLMLFAFAMLWVGALIGLSVGSPQVAASAGLIWLFPVVFMSNVFVDPSTMPAVVQAIAEWNPVSAIASGARELFGNQSLVQSDAWPMQHPVLAALLWCLLIVAIFAPLAVRKYKKAASK